MNLYYASAAIAFFMCLCVTPPVRALARRFDIVDRPDKHRKLHKHAIPLGGGIAVLIAFVATVLVVTALSKSQRAVFAGDVWFLVGAGASAGTICLVGLLDDRFGLRGRQKLVGQIIAASLFLLTGLRIESLQLLGFPIELGLLAIPFTLIWLLGSINALNLLDGADGLASTVGIVLSISIAATAILTGHRTEAFLALAMAGALAGFLVYNSPPASIFLGDAGSMLIGLTLGALAIRGSLKGSTTAVVLAVPAAIWAIPLFDVSMAIVRRRLTGRSIYVTDRGHLHHLAQRRGLGGWSTMFVIGGLCAVTATAAVISVYMHNEAVALVVVGVVFFTLIATRFFGHSECLLFCRRVKNFVRSLLPRIHTAKQPTDGFHTRFEGTRQWDELWETLMQYAERFELTAVQLNVSIPTINEDYHVNWKRNGQPSDLQKWRSEIPLVSHGITVGRLQIEGECQGESACVWMGDLLAGLKPFETHMLDLITQGRDISGASTDKDSGTDISNERQQDVLVR